MPIILFFVAIPLILWFPSASFANFYSTVFSLGLACGIIGLVLFSLNFVLATRLPIIDSLFSGINKAYIIHHLSGIFALVLLIAHPILLFIPLGFSIIYQWQGVAALVVLIVLLTLTLSTFVYKKLNLDYERWRSTHQFLGVSLLLAGLHIFETSRGQYLRPYMLSILTLGLIAWAYRTILGKFTIPRTPFFVKSVTALNDSTTEIILRPGLNTLKFVPGQFVFLSALGQTHPFSITAPKGQKDLSFAIKALGDYTTDIKNLKINTQVQVEGPFGRFSNVYCKNPHQIWIAGGIGITPFLSMSRSISPDSDLDAHLFYAVKNKSEAVYLAELQKNPHLKLHLHESATSGYLTADVIKKIVPDFKQFDVFVCGPTSLMKALRAQCKKLGIQGDMIHDEQFALQ